MRIPCLLKAFIQSTFIFDSNPTLFLIKNTRLIFFYLCLTFCEDRSFDFFPLFFAFKFELLSLQQKKRDNLFFNCIFFLLKITFLYSKTSLIVFIKWTDLLTQYVYSNTFTFTRSFSESTAWIALYHSHHRSAPRSRVE